MPDDVRRDDISYKIGDDRPIAWEVLELDGDALAAGEFSAHAQVRPYVGGPVLHEWSSTGTGPRARFTSQPGPDQADPVRWFVELLVDDSRGWTWERGQYDLFITDPEDRAQPIAEGVWVNRPAVTSG